jgi:hypothetical protein
VPLFRQLVASVSPRIPGSDAGPVHVGFVVDWALGQVFLRVLRFSFVSIFSPMLRTHLHLHAVRNRRTNVRSVGTLKKECCSDFGEQLIENLCHVWPSHCVISNTEAIIAYKTCLNTIFRAVQAFGGQIYCKTSRLP